MTEIEDLTPLTYSYSKEVPVDPDDPSHFLTAVGFLGETLPENAEPPVPPTLCAELLAFWNSPGPNILWGGLGWHSCGLCRPRMGGRGIGTPIRIGELSAVLGCGFIEVPGPNTIFVAPSLVIHYIDAHGYRPPAAFLRAFATCPPRSSRAYLKALRRLGPPVFRWEDSYDEYTPAWWRRTIARVIVKDPSEQTPLRQRAWRLLRRF